MEKETTLGPLGILVDEEEKVEKEKPMPEDIKTVKGERDSLRKENMELRAKVLKLEQDFASTQTNLHELMAKHGASLKKPYEYAEDECRPVPLHGVCEQCGWVRQTQLRPGETKRSAHSIL